MRESVSTPSEDKKGNLQPERKKGIFMLNAQGKLGVKSISTATSLEKFGERIALFKREGGGGLRGRGGVTNSNRLKKLSKKKLRIPPSSGG